MRAQSNFNFTRETSPGVYDTSWRLNAALPFSNGSIYIAHANATGGKIVKSFSGRYGDIVNKPVLWTYVRNGSTAKAYLDGTLEHSVGTLNSNFKPGDVGRFTLGNGFNTSQFANMKFYGLFLFKRALSDTDLFKMNTYLMNKFKI